MTESAYSPVLWGAIVIPILSGLELWADPATRGILAFFALALIYLISVRYTIAVAIGVFAHEENLKNHKSNRIGITLWTCYFIMLILCALLVPTTALYGLDAVIALTIVILIISIAQGLLSSKKFDAKQQSNIKWRIGYDALIIVFVLADYYFSDSPTYQAPAIAMAFLLVMDFKVSDSARANMTTMISGLKRYFQGSWKKAQESTS